MQRMTRWNILWVRQVSFSGPQTLPVIKNPCRLLCIQPRPYWELNWWKQFKKKKKTVQWNHEVSCFQSTSSFFHLYSQITHLRSSKLNKIFFLSLVCPSQPPLLNCIHLFCVSTCANFNFWTHTHWIINSLLY